MALSMFTLIVRSALPLAILAATEAPLCKTGGYQGSEGLQITTYSTFDARRSGAEQEHKHRTPILQSKDVAFQFWGVEVLVSGSRSAADLTAWFNT
jgi:hypothetical protein